MPRYLGQPLDYDNDVYRNAGDIMDVHLGLSPRMRASIDRDRAIRERDEEQFQQATTSGTNPLMLALAFPDLFKSRTGMAVDFDMKGAPLLYSTSEAGVQQLYGQREAERMDRLAALSRGQVEDQLGLERLHQAFVDRNSPTAIALRNLDPEIAKRIVLDKSGYTGTYGYGEVPPEHTQKQELERIRQAPQMASVEQRGKEFEALGPAREFGIETGRKKLELEEREGKLKALADEMRSVVLSLQNEYDPLTRAKAMEQLQSIQDQMHQMLGIQKEPAQGPSGIPADAIGEISRRYNPRKYAGKSMLFRDPATGKPFVLMSDGASWKPANAPTMYESQGASRRGA